MKTALILFVLLAFLGCKSPCDENLRIGELVQIPVHFVGFSISEINNILVYRIDKSNSNKIDTLLMNQILWAGEARSMDEIITDRVSGKTDINMGYYDSYFNNCHLIFDWYSGKDTLSDIEIIKSQEKVDDCHKNDPNIRIDKLSFVHKGTGITKNQKIEILK